MQNQLSLEIDKNKKERVFEKWKGNNIFLNKGKIILGPKKNVYNIIIFISIILFFSSMFYFLIAPCFKEDYKTIMISGFTFFLTIFLYFYFLIVFTEPGYLPHKNLLKSQKNLNLKNNENKKIFEYISGFENMEFEKKDEEVQKKKINLQKLHFCEICLIYKPDRTSHCKSCNACVRVYDHHCTLTNNCIGKRNYIYFILMVIFGATLNLFFISSLVIISDEFSKIGYIYIFIFVLIGLEMIFIFAYLIFHIVIFFFLKKTTKELFFEKEEEEVFKEKIDLIKRSQSLIRFDQVYNQE